MCIEFNLDTWLTPNTYNINCEYPPKRSGVYIIVASWWIKNSRKRYYKILYIGQSKNLKERYEKHEVIKRAKNEYEYVQFFFLECSNHIEIEKKLIKKYKPLYNKHGKTK